VKLNRIFKKIFIPILLGFLILKLVACNNSSSQNTGDITTSLEPQSQQITTHTTKPTTTPTVKPTPPILPPNPNVNKIPENIEELGRETTVFITGRGEPGSGVIVHKNPGTNTYYVLTARHVVGIPPEPGEVDYVIKTPDDREHIAATSDNYQQKVTKLDNADLAIIEFTAEENQKYQVAPLTDTLSSSIPVYAFGWTSCYNDDSSLRKQFQKTKGEICEIKEDKEDKENRWTVRYTNNIVVGVSGGPVFDGLGRVVAIQAAFGNKIGKEKIGCDIMPIKPDNEYADALGVSIQENIQSLNYKLSSDQKSIQLQFDSDPSPKSVATVECRKFTKSCPPILEPGQKC
jgi:hypothetical protein